MQTFDRIAIKEEARQILSENRSICVVMALAMVLAALALTAVSAGFLTLLLEGMITVTASTFFLACWRRKPVTLSEAVSSAFDQGFLRKVGGMLWMLLQVFLWSLLFVIPGIVKAISFALTPYILAEFPNVPAMEATEISERMMRGHKMDYFVMRLSFLGWELLSAFTFGILYVLHVSPYLELTRAGVYEELKQIALDAGVVTSEELLR